MTLTLWRGDELLGELRTRPPSPHLTREAPDKPPSLSGFLIPSVHAPAFTGVWQLHVPIPGMGVEQYTREPDIVAERHLRSARQVTNPGPVVLQPMSLEAMKGVPVEVQLTVRDDQGRKYLPLQVLLEETRSEPQHYEAVLSEVPAEALVNGSIWCAFVVFASEADAPPF